LKGFRVFPDGRGHWCADKDDGTVSGIFFSRTAAIRFARKENDYDLALKSGAVLPDLMTEERF
jgi:hypothetical protein